MTDHTLIGTITEKATSSYKGPNGDMIDVENGVKGDGFKKWEKHWLDTAKSWRDELQKEGLTKTVEQLNKTIAFFEQGNGE